MSLLYPVVPWAQASNVYEVNIRQYTAEGNFTAFMQHLPRLKEMGVSILWLMPITPISKKGRKGDMGSYYACSSYTEVNPEFGTADDLHALIAKAHELGFKLIIDWVANHTGLDHEWTETNPDYYLRDANGHFMETHGWDDVIDLNYNNPALVKAMIAAMQYWVKEFDIDGFRCDMAHLVPLHFWKEAREQCDERKPLFWLAECDEDNYLEVFDANYAWRWMQASRAMKRHQNRGLTEVMPLLDKYLPLRGKIAKLLFTSNHDENSWNGTEYDFYGNEAHAVAVFTCLYPALPLIYSGQELPNRKKLAFFDKDPISWGKGLPGLHSFYKTLLHFRSSNPELYGPEALFQLLTVTDPDRILAFSLSWKEKILIAVFNFSGGRQQVTLSFDNLEGKYYSLFSQFVYSFSREESFDLGPSETLVYVKKG